LLNLGAYARGSNVDLDEYLDKASSIQGYLRQRVEEGVHIEDSVARLSDIIRPKIVEEAY
jgi:flagellar biosynthesis/type III secretory pathway ATPase